MTDCLEDDRCRPITHEFALKTTVRVNDTVNSELLRLDITDLTRAEERRRASVDGHHECADKPMELPGLRRDGGEFQLELS